MRWILAMLLLNSCLPIFAAGPINGKWYRNVPFAEATLKVDPSYHFHIDASYAANFGEIDGTLHKIRDGLYYTVIDDEALDENCLIVMAVDNNLLVVTLYGDEVGAGADVYYEGKYHRHPMSESQFRRKALHWILPKGIRQQTVTDMLGSNLDYFIQCFAVKTSIPPQDSDIKLAYQGFSPGVADAENGILALGDKYIYILFQDVRKQKPEFQYYTNAPKGMPFPKTLGQWIGDRTEVPVVRHYKAKALGSVH